MTKVIFCGGVSDYIRRTTKMKTTLGTRWLSKKIKEEVEYNWLSDADLIVPIGLWNLLPKQNQNSILRFAIDGKVNLIVK